MSLKYLWATVQFITRIPIPQSWSKDAEFENYGRGIPYFPVVGLIVGLIAAFLTSWLLVSTHSPYIAAIGYVLALAIITGGFHLDGLADTCDGIFSARKRERMLEIMRDSRIGTHGCLALIFALFIKAAAVLTLATTPSISTLSLFSLLICAPIAGRTAMILGMYGQRYAREGEGMGNIYIGKISQKEAAIALISGVVMIGFLAGLAGFFAIAITLLVAFALARYFRYHLNGQTGDTLGALEELSESIFLVALLWS